MLRNFVRYAICLVLAVIGVLLAITFIGPLLSNQPKYALLIVVVGTGLVMAAVGYFLLQPVGRFLEKLTERIMTRMSQLTMAEIISMAVGLIIGLVIASLIGTALSRIVLIGPYLAILLILFLGYMGLLVGYRRGEDMANFFAGRRHEGTDKTEKSERNSRAERREKKKGKWQAPPKVLDTSVIIDSRISDVYRSGFLEGELVVAGFVLAELRHIADSSDSLKRNRGRGGLDCLNQMQQEFGAAIVIDERDYPDITEVDAKLLCLAQDLQGVVVTNDYNLNKVAQLQGMRVLNINELSNAVKPIALPGEEMAALIVKEGKEMNQGIAYLNDGTMIVVENSRQYIGRRLQVVVTSILQTAAGRMVFARPKQDKDGNVLEVG